MEAQQTYTANILGHGFVRLVDVMGTDSSIVQAARVSYGAGTKTPSDDRKLIRYLLRNRHTSPFEMVELKFHIKLPIFVARQWVRHRTASINEVSARYSEMPNEMYIPTQWKHQSTSNKQGSGDSVCPTLNAHATERVEKLFRQAFSTYSDLLSAGIAREQARIVLPTALFTEWYWKIDLHNLLHFLRLRLDSHAQYEIRVYAEQIYAIVKERFPVTAEAFEDYVLSTKEGETKCNLSVLSVRRTIQSLPQYVRRYGVHCDDRKGSRWADISKQKEQKMTLKTAIKILEHHRQWRCGKRDDLPYAPFEITKALDILLDEVHKNLTEKKEQEMSTQRHATWVSVEEALPQALQTVWLTNGMGIVWLGCRVVADGEWYWAESNGIIYADEKNIVSECEIADLDVRFWRELPTLPGGNNLYTNNHNTQQRGQGHEYH